MREQERKTQFKKFSREKKKDDFLNKDFMKKRACRFCLEKVDSVDYKDINKLQRYTTAKGKIVSRRISGNCAGHQRKVKTAIKRARFLALLPYVRI